MSDKKTYTTSNGCPVLNPMAAQQIGQPGPLVLQDHHLIDLLAHFDRERIPERVVHAKGWGAFGEFECTDDVTDICAADFLSKVGKKVKTFTRFSTVAGEKGYSDTARDPRGFSTKLYTDEGVMDWVYNNTPVFFIRNPIKFPYFIHTQKRDPQTGRRDNEMQWDYWVNNQETIHQLMQLFSDRGTPASLRKMNGYSGHTYKWINAKGEWLYVQIHLISDQGIENFTDSEAVKVGGENPDHHGQDLFNAIEKGDYPSWTAYVQTMTEEQAKKFKYSVFDLTKVWPHKEYPLRRFGKLTLNKNPENYFAEVEQAAFSPAHVVPGWEPSADPVLQSRLFSYSDTHRHRLGVNYQQIPVNKPLQAFNPFQRDGAGQVDGNYGSLPNYPATKCPVGFGASAKINDEVRTEQWPGTITNFHWSVDESQKQEYEQPAALWKVLGKTPGQQENFVNNVSGHLSQATPATQDKVFGMFRTVDKGLGDRIESTVLKLTGRRESTPRL